MTKQEETNAALCRAIGVEKSAVCPACDGTGNFYRHDEDGDFLECDECRDEPMKAYPDLTSADVLMAALRKAEHQFKASDCMAEVWRNGGGFSYATILPNETHGSMLFRAACAAFGIEVSE